MSAAPYVEGVLDDRGAVRVSFADGRITALEPIATLEPTAGSPPLQIWPGLVDLQVNGYHGIDLNADGLTAGQVARLTRELWRCGVTTFCPTIVTAPEAKITAALRALADARRDDALVAHSIPCVHVEGPYVSSLDGPRGAHDAAAIRPPDIAELHRWQAACGGLVGVVTLAPELPGASEYIAALAAAGIVASLGHSAASPEQIHRGAQAGARMSTHLGNGLAPMLPRHPNLIWAQLADDRLTAGVIADGDHLPKDTLIAILRAKPRARSLLVSDCAALAGAPPGDYLTPVGGAVTVTAAGRLELTGSGLLAGSGHNLFECVRWALEQGCVTVPEALTLAAANPARMLGLADRGRLSVGSSADLVLVGERAGRLEVRGTVVAGEAIRSEPPGSGRTASGPCATDAQATLTSTIAAPDSARPSA